MKFSTLFLTLSVSMACFSVQSAETIQHSHARGVLDAENASYVIIEAGSDINVITYGYKTASETCKFLIKKGVTVKNVENYAITDKKGSMNITISDC